jgi:hypothetical protein
MVCIYELLYTLLARFVDGVLLGPNWIQQISHKKCKVCLRGNRASLTHEYTLKIYWVKNVSFFIPNFLWSKFLFTWKVRGLIKCIIKIKKYLSHSWSTYQQVHEWSEVCINTRGFSHYSLEMLKIDFLLEKTYKAMNILPFATILSETIENTWCILNYWF